MIVSIESEGSNVRVEQEDVDTDMLLEEVFNLLIEPALLGFGYQRGSILEVCEQYIVENSEDFITKTPAKEVYDEDEDDEEPKDKCSKYTSGYDRGYLAGLREAMLKLRELT